MVVVEVVEGLESTVGGPREPEMSCWRSLTMPLLDRMGT